MRGRNDLDGELTELGGRPGRTGFCGGKASETGQIGDTLATIIFIQQFLTFQKFLEDGSTGGSSILVENMSSDRFAPVFFLVS